MPKILIQTGERRGFALLVGEEPVTIGRDPNNMIVLPDQQVSRLHAQILWQDNAHIIEDVGSANGTFVNNNLVSKVPLKYNDVIKVGDTKLVFLAPEAAEHVEEEVPHVHQSDIQDLSGFTIECSVLPDDVSPKRSHAVPTERHELKKAYERLRMLYTVSRDLGTLEALPALLDKILALIIEITNAERSFIMLIDMHTGEFLPHVIQYKKGYDGPRDIPISKSIVQYVQKNNQGLLTSDAMQDSRLKDAESIITHEIRSAMCVPLKGQERTIGIMHVDTRAKGLRFSKDDLELLTAIGSEVALAIENARLYDDLKKAYQDLKEKQAQLIASEKIAALGQLASGIVHEINNPLSTIMGYSDLVGRMFDKMEQIPKELAPCRKYFEVISKQVQRCHGIAQDLLNLARRKKPQMVATNINDVLEDALAVAHYHMQRATIQVHKDLASPLPEIQADSNQIQQVFLNMIINAKDAMSSGGTLSIITREVETGWVEAQFTDTGCGIPPDKVEEIFKPLFTTKGEGKGTGLGLSVSREIIENHRGSISVASTVGKGTTFSIQLPVAGAHEATESK